MAAEKQNRRRHSPAFAYFIIGVLCLIFIAIVSVLVLAKPAEGVVTLLGGWGGAILALIAVGVNFEFGSSKGSQMKDEIAARKGEQNAQIASDDGPFGD